MSRRRSVGISNAVSQQTSIILDTVAIIALARERCLSIEPSINIADALCVAAEQRLPRATFSPPIEMTHPIRNGIYAHKSNTRSSAIRFIAR